MEWRALLERYPAQAAFIAGYRDAGGPDGYIEHLIEEVIPCESGWQNIPYTNGYVSVAQFHPDSWERAGGGNPLDLYQVGGNVARWIAAISDPGGGGGWPVCWHAGQ